MKTRIDIKVEIGDQRILMECEFDILPENAGFMEWADVEQTVYSQMAQIALEAGRHVMAKIEPMSEFGFFPGAVKILSRRKFPK